MIAPQQILGHSTLVAATASAIIDLPIGDTIRIAVNEAANNTGAWFKLGDANSVAAIGTASVSATATLTSTGVLQNNETVTIGTRTYTYKTALTGGGVTANEVLIGANQTESHLNLLRAVNLGAGAGTLYGSATVQHATITAISSDGTHTIFNAKTPGTAGNAFASTETAANASFAAGVFASGTDGVETSFFVPTRGELYLQRNGATHLAGIRAGSADAVVSILGLG